MTHNPTSGDGDDSNAFGAGLKGPDRGTAEAEASTTTKTKGRRRGSRGGRRARRKKVAEPKADDGEPGGNGAATAKAEKRAKPARKRPEKTERSEAKRPRRSKRKRSRGSAEKPSPETATETASKGAEEGVAEKAPRRRRGKRGGRGRRKKEQGPALEIEVIPGEEDDLPELSELPDEAELIAGGKTAKKRGRRDAKATKKTKSKAAGKKTSKAVSKKEEAKRTGMILVNANGADEIRVAVVEDGRIADLQMTVKRFSSYVNDIYRGRVVNLESAIGAAFVDFGQGRNGFLHASDVIAAYGEPDWKLEKLLTTEIDSEDWDSDDAPDDGDDEQTKGKSKSKGKRGKKPQGARKGRPRRPRLPIEKLLNKGQMAVCQITKDAIGDKGPTLTTYISIPGRYLVLMPSLSRTGVSRKIEDDKERRRLKRILQSLDIPAGMGVIVRTAGVGKTKAEIKRDLDYLLLAWDDFSRRLVSGRNPAPLYQESDVSVRTMRDLFSATTDKVIVDDAAVYERMVEFTKKLMPENVDRIHLHEGPRPIFHAHGVEQDFERIFQRRVELPSGGSIVMDQTEALVAIDVNSGRTREGADFEEIALKTNLEAAPEIARQIRLRDLGGIIVLDFIDMMRAGNRRAVERAFREALSKDRARSKVGRISQFGLLELTRQRLGPGLSKLIYDNCQSCRGSGRRRSAASRAEAILRRLGYAMTQKGFSRVEVRAHEDAIQLLKREHLDRIDALCEQAGREIELTVVPDQVEDSVLRYLRADGREVRPGGRKKR